jgi:preprotein translocase subunit SecE
MAETKVEKKAKSNKVADFFLGVAAEFTKIMWPKRDDVIKQTSVVVVLTMIVCAVIAILDAAFGAGMSFLTSL